jgi:hypothetical protein
MIRAKAHVFACVSYFVSQFNKWITFFYGGEPTLKIPHILPGSGFIQFVSQLV